MKKRFEYLFFKTFMIISAVFLILNTILVVSMFKLLHSMGKLTIILQKWLNNPLHLSDPDIKDINTAIVSIVAPLLVFISAKNHKIKTDE
ncbi:hypothetical protein [Enterococcus faecium]|uniref:Uncharacterized protein n=1 Tax=Enterococcus faecium TaxID=1352 RepID=A0A6A8NG40_ENTFC|nr:hypothetical protein [Enterococcus faecium]MBD9707709.1 hypothetical protein [Enterococcus faecium]MTD23320.1 hypothetical protein [Enterococcus faecium]MTD35026.1 hypothetical protein [Enterococcus faecium]